MRERNADEVEDEHIGLECMQSCNNNNNGLYMRDVDVNKTIVSLVE